MEGGRCFNSAQPTNRPTQKPKIDAFFFFFSHTGLGAAFPPSTITGSLPKSNFCGPKRRRKRRKRGRKGAKKAEAEEGGGKKRGGTGTGSDNLCFSLRSFLEVFVRKINLLSIGESLFRRRKRPNKNRRRKEEEEEEEEDYDEEEEEQGGRNGE